MNAAAEGVECMSERLKVVRKDGIDGESLPEKLTLLLRSVVGA